MKLKKVALCLLICILVVQGTSIDTYAAEKKSNSAYNEKLLACLIYCESGSQPYAGKLAVGIIVMNRVKSGRYPSTVKGVIYQKNQFSPVKTGKLKRVMKSFDAGKFKSADQKECIKAAKEALGGNKKVKYKNKSKSLNGYLFFNTSLKNSRYSIASHKFK